MKAEKRGKKFGNHGHGQAQGDADARAAGEQKNQVHGPGEQALAGSAPAHGRVYGAEAEAGVAADIGMVGDGQRGHAIGGPGAEPPVEKSVGGGRLVGRGRTQDGDAGAQIEIVGPVREGPEQQRRADPAANHHGHPAERGILRLAPAQADMSVLAGSQPQQKEHDAEYHQQQRRAEYGRKFVERPLSRAVGLGGKQGKAANQDENHSRGNGQQRRVQFGSGSHGAPSEKIRACGAQRRLPSAQRRPTLHTGQRRAQLVADARVSGAW